jgi:hypothetical protein
MGDVRSRFFDKLLVIQCLSVALLLVAGGLLASEMGFKVRYQLHAIEPHVSRTGLNHLGLPYRPKPSLVTARDLFRDIERVGTGSVHMLLRHRPADNMFDYYTYGGGNVPPNGWTLTPGEAVIVKAGRHFQYNLVGSHDSTVAIHLIGGDNPASATGENYVAVPYHTIAKDARELFDEIGGSVHMVSRYDGEDDYFDIYTFGGGSMPPNGWDLEPGEACVITVTQDQTWIPSHY